MKIILIGGPSCGKGVQAKMICESFRITHISTGELLREEIKQNTVYAQKIKEVVTSGGLVTDDAVLDLVKNQVLASKNGYLLDGFPRTMTQATKFNEFDKPDIVILLETDYNIALSRVLNRRICLNCKSSLNVDQLKNNHCPFCSGSVSTRIDDNAEVFKKRYEIFKMQSAPLIKYYGDMGVLVRVQNNNSIDETFKIINEYLLKLKD